MVNAGIYEEDYGSDNESMSADVHSPADGYFAQRPFPNAIFVEDSSVSAEAEAKAQEAAEQRARTSHTQPSPHRSSPVSAARSPRWPQVHENTPLLDAGPAPPDYEAATAHRRMGSVTSAASSFDISETLYNYGGTDEPQDGRARGVSEVRNWMFRSGPSQSMANEQPRYSDGNETDVERAAPAQHQDGRGRRGWLWLYDSMRSRASIKWLFVLVVIGIVLVLSLSNSDAGDASDQPHFPVADPAIPDGPTGPAIPPQSTLPPHHASSDCDLHHYTAETTWAFQHISDFSLSEIVDGKTPLSSSVGGTIYIQPASVDQKQDIAVTASYATSRSWRVKSLKFRKDENGLQLQFPNVETLDSAGLRCMDIVIAVRVKEGIQLEDWVTVTGSLNVVAEANLFSTDRPYLGITNRTAISTVSGKVDLKYWSSRHTYIETTHGAITGNYALRDLLSLKSSSGRIAIAVDPKEAEEDHVVPAEFIASSNSGSTSVTFPLAGRVPERVYRSHVETSSGSITGDYYLGPSTSLKSKSGSIRAHLLPYDWQHSNSLYTETNSGRTEITVLPSYIGGDNPMGKLASHHKTSAGSGSVVIRYPRQWEGYIQAQSRSGSVKVHGEGVVVDVDSHPGYVGRTMIAHKGKNDSRVEVKSSSGSVNVQIGND